MCAHALESITQMTFHLIELIARQTGIGETHNKELASLGEGELGVQLRALKKVLCIKMTKTSWEGVVK